MHSRPLGKLGRILLAGCALGLGASVALAQSSSSSAGSTASTGSTAKGDSSPSRMDVFLGYSYLAPHGTVTTTTPVITTGPFSDSYSSINEGAIGSFAYYFNRYVGGQVEYANHPSGSNDGASDFGLGMIFRYPASGMTPFAHALAGAVRLGGPNSPPDLVWHGYTWGPALTVGGGLDYELPFANQRFALRLFQADYQYYHVDFGPAPQTGGRANVSSARLSAGLVMHFGSIVPPPPVGYSCTASPDSVYPGEQVTVTCTATNLNPKKKTTYSWSGSQGLTVSGTNSSTTLDTTNLQPGDYTVTGHVTQGPKPGQSADATTHFTVKQFEPPTVSCTADPTTVQPGGTSTITATGVSPQNLSLTYSYSASAGSISGTSNTATLATTGAPSGTITVTCNVQDKVGQTASSTTTVDVEAPPPPPAPKTQTLCSITFNRDKRARAYNPTRVNNEAKACLDDVALNAQQKPDATIVLVGNSAPTKTPKTRWEREHWPTAEKQAAQRAINTKAYLVTEKGIDASRIQVRTGTSGQNEVDDYLVPAGANFDNDVPGTTAVDESLYKAQPRNPVHHHYRRHHHHKAAASGTTK